jgi:hypothetical protein
MFDITQMREDANQLSRLSTEAVLTQDNMLGTQIEFAELITKFLDQADAGTQFIYPARGLVANMKKQRADVLEISMEVNRLSKRVAGQFDDLNEGA